MRPEIFQDRWRTDKDPTRHLATYAASTKKPLSHSVVAAGEALAVLDEDLQTQFTRDMLALNALDPNAKQHALKQLKPALNKFSTIVARFVFDSKILKTSQGRGAGRSETSIIAKKTQKQPPPPKPMFTCEGSAASALSCAKGYGAGAPASARSRPGNNRHIEDKWTCPVCKTGIKNCTQSIKQHKGSQSHIELLAKLYYCEACNIYCDNTPDAIKQHLETYEHGQQRRLEADTRDGSKLANKRRLENDGKVPESAKKQKKSI